MKCYVVAYKKNKKSWINTKIHRLGTGKSQCKVIETDTAKDAEFAANEYRKIGYEVRIVEKA